MAKFADWKRDRLLTVVRGPLSRAMCDGDYKWVAGFLAGRFGVTVSASQIERWWKSRPGGNPRLRCWDWSDGTFAMWLKNRLSDSNLLPVADVNPFNGSLPVELHVGFLSLEETAEMLARLRKSDNTPVKTGPDTPGIERREAPKGAINRTAAKVLHS